MRQRCKNSISFALGRPLREGEVEQFEARLVNALREDAKDRDTWKSRTPPQRLRAVGDRMVRQLEDQARAQARAKTDALIAQRDALEAQITQATTTLELNERAAPAPPDGADSQTLFQEGGKPSGETIIRGSTTFDFDQQDRVSATRMRLTENANLSTFLHETGHTFVELLQDLASAENATADIRAMWADLMDWWGLDGDTRPGVEEHELFARTFEAYLMKGKAPSLSLQRIFETFKKWLTAIYSTLRLHHNLTPEVESVMDRIFATDAEIELARAAQGATPGIFKSREEAGMTEAQWLSYLARRQQSDDEARAILTTAAMEAHLRQQTAWWNRELAKKRRLAAQEVDTRSVNRAHDWLAFGKWRGNVSRAKPAGFTTAKGSTYVVNADGTTTRNKAARAEHPGDQGPQPRSHHTVYVSEEAANALAPPQGSWRVHVGPKGISLLTRHKDGGWGVSPSQRDLAYETQPAEGLIPVELWNADEQTSGAWHRVHFGNVITEISTKGADLEPAWGFVDPPADLPPMRLNQRAVAEDYGDDVLANLPLSVRPIDQAHVAELMEIAKRARAARRGGGPKTLASFVVAMGGVKDDGGDVLKMLGSYQRRPGLINNKKGRSVDEMALLAWEAGFFGARPAKGNSQEFFQADDITAGVRLENVRVVPAQPGAQPTLGQLVEVRTNMPDADFWIVRRGAANKVGSVTREFNPEAFGVKVTARNILHPDYLYYALMHVHSTGRFEAMATGTTALVNIRKGDVTGLAIGARLPGIPESRSGTVGEEGVRIDPRLPIRVRQDGVTFYQRDGAQPRQTQSPLFHRWFQNSVVRKKNGTPRVVFYAGTYSPQAFDEYAEPTKFGLVHHFVKAKHDANEYADVPSEGLENEIEDRATLAVEAAYNVVPLNARASEARQEEATEAIQEELGLSDGVVTPVYLSIQNPVVFGGDNETYLTFDGNINVVSFTANEGLDVAAKPTGQLVEFIEAVKEAAKRFGGDQKALSDLLDVVLARAAANGNRISAQEIYRIFFDRAARTEEPYEGEGGGERALDDFMTILQESGLRVDTTAARGEQSEQDVLRAFQDATRHGYVSQRLRAYMGRDDADILSFRYPGNLKGHGQYHAWPEILRLAYEAMGFDGVVDNTQHRAGARGKLSSKLTTWFYPFRANQIKSAIGNLGTFDPRSSEILYQEEGRPTPRQFLDALDTDLRGEPIYRVEDIDEAWSRESDRDWAHWFEQRNIDLSANQKDLQAQIEAALAKELSDPDAMHPDIIAEAFGFDSGDALLRALTDMPDRREQIEARAKQMIRDEYGDPFEDGRFRDEARAAAHRLLQARVIELELDALERATGGSARAVGRAARKVAIERVDTMTVGEVLAYERFLGAERRFALAAQQALERGDRALAAIEKKSQLIAFHTYYVARDAAEQIQRALDYFKGFDRARTRANIDNVQLDQIDQLLEQFELRRLSIAGEGRRQSLAAWAYHMQQQGLDHLIAVDPRRINDARKRPFRTLTFDEVKGLRASIRNLEHLGRLKEKLLVKREQERIQDVENQIVARIEQTGTISERTRKGFQPNLVERVDDARRQFHAESTKPEFLFRLLDGLEDNGPVWRHLFRPIAEAEAAELEMGQIAAARMTAIFAAYTPKERARFFTRPSLVAKIGRSMTKAEMMAVALNMGNAYNKAALMEGYRWNEEQLAAITDGLDKRDWDVVQSIWDWIAEFKEPRFALHERMTGVRPEAVEATPVQTNFGVYAGGYYPVKYDPTANERTFMLGEKATTLEEFGGNFIRPATKQGALIQRQGSGGQTVRLDLNVLNEHIAESIHDITHREAVIDTLRLIERPAIQEAIIAAFGGDRSMYRILRPWLSSIAGDPKMPNTILEKVASRARANATIVSLGWKITTALVQPLGILGAVPRLGVGPIAKAVSKLYGRPDRLGAAIQFAMERSSMLRFRMDTFDRDVRDALVSIRGRAEGDVVPIGVRKSFFWLTGVLDLGVAVPVWMAAYDQARAGKIANINPLNEDEAIQFADSVVRMTQGSGSVKDQPTLLRQKGFMRLFTMFQTYFSTLYNQLYVEQMPGLQMSRIPPWVFAVNMMWLWFLPAVLAEIMQGRGAPDDDETEADALARVATTTAVYPLMSVIGLRDLVGATTTDFGYSLSPVATAGEVTTDLAKSVITGDFDDGTLKSAVLTPGYIFGLPSRQFWITMDYARDVAGGVERPAEDPGSIWSEGLMRDTR